MAAAAAGDTCGPPLAGNIQVSLGRGDLPVAIMSHESGASCEVILTGAHVTSWKTRDGVERLYVSSASKFETGAAVRGGIPVCFPQFAGRGSLPKHGFVRTSSEWEIAEMSSEGGDCRLVLSLCDTAATREVWPHAFEVRYAVTLKEDGLSTELEVLNKGEAELTFTAALHTYFAVSDVGGARVLGLDGLTYEDNAAAGATATETQKELAIDGEVDRVYLDAPSTVVLRYPAAGARGDARCACVCTGAACADTCREPPLLAVQALSPSPSRTPSATWCYGTLARRRRRACPIWETASGATMCASRLVPSDSLSSCHPVRASAAARPLHAINRWSS